MTKEGTELAPSEGDLRQLRELIETMKKAKDADEQRIARLEARLDKAEADLADAKRKVTEASGGLLDLF